MRTKSSRFIAIAAALGLIAFSGARSRAQESLTLDAVLDRLHAYLRDYATQLPATIARTIGRSWNDSTLMAEGSGIRWCPQ